MRLRALCFAKSRWAVLKLTCGLVTQEYWWQASAAVSCVSELCDIIEKCNLLLQQPAASPARHCFYGIDLDFSFQLFLCDLNIKIYSIFLEKYWIILLWANCWDDIVAAHHQPRLRHRLPVQQDAGRWLPELSLRQRRRRLRLGAQPQTQWQEQIALKCTNRHKLPQTY